MQVKRRLKILGGGGGVGIVKNGCGRSGEETLKLTGSEELTDGITDFLHVGTDSQKLKAEQKFFG